MCLHIVIKLSTRGIEPLFSRLIQLKAQIICLSTFEDWSEPYCRCLHNHRRLAFEGLEANTNSSNIVLLCSKMILLIPSFR